MQGLVKDGLVSIRERARKGWFPKDSNGGKSKHFVFFVLSTNAFYLEQSILFAPTAVFCPRPHGVFHVKYCAHLCLLGFEILGWQTHK